MSHIGTFTRDGEAFVGTITILSSTAEATIQPVCKTKAREPDYRVFVAGVEIGAAWKRKRLIFDRPHLFVKLDDPSLPRAILGELGNGEFWLLWSR